jgi:mRNA-degrading endonuclease RelE of RelBE toxin-antitoxin system
MRAIKIYQPHGPKAPMLTFIETLDPKLQKKLRRQFHLLAHTELNALREPHYKHFVLEKYSQFYELREKNKVLVRIIFMIDGEDILLLTPFIKRQPRDTMRALEASLGILAEIRADPSLAVNMNFWEEETK